MPTRSTLLTRISCTLTLSPPSSSLAASISSPAASIEVRIANYDIGNVGGWDGAVQSVGAQEQHIALQYQVVAGVDAHEHAVAERAGEHVAGLGFGRFTGGDQTQTGLLADHGMVARERRRAAVANGVAARIADVRDHHAVEPQSAGYQCGGHGPAARIGGQPGLEDLLVGGLNQARH